VWWRKVSKHERSEKRRMETMVEPAAREQLIKVLDALPQEAFADVADHVEGLRLRYEESNGSGTEASVRSKAYTAYVRREITTGLKDLEEGRTFTQEEIEALYPEL